MHCNLREAELVGAEPQRRPHRRVELRDGPPPERLDPVVERPDALNRPVREALCKSAVAFVEPARDAGKRPVRVGVVLEHPQDGVERGPPRRRDHDTRPTKIAQPMRSRLQRK